jgi:hypothetical protein
LHTILKPKEGTNIIETMKKTYVKIIKKTFSPLLSKRFRDVNQAVSKLYRAACHVSNKLFYMCIFHFES